MNTVTISIEDYDKLRNDLAKAREILKKKATFKLVGDSRYGYPETLFSLSKEDEYWFIKQYIESLESKIQKLESQAQVKK